MVTFMVRKNQVDKDYSLQDLKKFSEEKELRVIIPGLLTMEKGVIVWLN